MKEKNWYERFVTPIGVNIWAPEWYPQSIRGFQAEAIAEVLEESGATVGFTFQGFSQDHFGVSFFPTAMGRVHRNLAPGRDHLAEYQAALKKRGIRFFAYYCFQDRAIWEEQPDFRVRDALGMEVMGDHFGDLCPNSPYREHVIRRVSEIARRYEPDGWLLDMLQFATSQPVCYCGYCRRKYRLRYGRELPTGMPDTGEGWRLLLKWRYACVEALLADIRAAVKEITPDTVITHNAFALRNADEWITGEDYEALFPYDDVVTNIVNWEYTPGEALARSPDMLWKAGYYTRVFRGLSQKPVWMQVSRFLYQRDYTVVPQRELETSLFAIVTAGGCPFLIDNAFPDGTVDARAARQIAAAYQRIGAKAEYLEPAADMRYAAVLFSKDSQDWCDLAQPGEGRYGQGMQGLCQLLTEAHLPYQVISDRALSADVLRQYPVVLLSDCVVMSARVEALLEAYARAGGILVCMGPTGLVGEGGEPLEAMRLGEALGIRHRGPRNDAVSFLSPAQGAFSADFPTCIPLRACYPERFDVREGVSVVLHTQWPATEVVPKRRVFTYGMDVAPGQEREPFASVHPYGEGKALYLGGNLARCYGIYGDGSLKRIMASLLTACARPPLETNAPACVEIAVYEQADRLIVHLLNYASGQLRGTGMAGGTALEEHVPIHDVRVSVACESAARVRLEDGQALPFAYEGGRARFTVPVVDTHLIVVVEREGRPADGQKPI